MIKRTFSLFVLIIIICCCNNCSDKNSILEKRWRDVIRNQPDEWFGSEEAIRVAENVLLYQMDIGGWPKNKNMHHPLSDKEKEELLKIKSNDYGSTIDNWATTSEMYFLSKVYEKTKNEAYKKAFLKGVNYLFIAQYENGGWPQFYPIKNKSYSRHITYNDNAMVNVLIFMKDIFEKKDTLTISNELPDSIFNKARKAYDKGIEIILKTQYIQNDTLTVWCAQHHPITLEPAQARAYEFPSLSGSESAFILQFLMDIENPSPEIIKSIDSGVAWFEKVTIRGIKIEKFKNDEGKDDRRVVKDINAPPIWARFYSLDENRPMFGDWSGEVKNSLAEINHSKRNGYLFYVTSPKEMLEKYESWRKKWITKN